VLSRLQTAWNQLTRPDSTVEDIEARQRTQLLSGLLVVFIVVVAVLALVTTVSLPFPRLFSADSPFLQLTVTLVVLLGAYALNRRKHTETAAWLLVGLTWAIPCWAALSVPTLDGLVYLVLPVLLALLLLPLGHARYVTLVCVSTLLFFALRDGPFSISKFLASPLVLILTAHAILWLTARYRAHWEQEHRTRQIASENSYRQLVQFSPNPIMVHRDGRIIFTNTAGAELLGGRNAKELIGRVTLDFVHPDQRETAALLLKEAETLKTVFRFVEQQLVRVDGTVVEVETAIIPVVYQGVPALQIAYRNIDRHKQQEAAERSRRKLAETMRDTATALASTLNLEEVFDHILRYTDIVPHDAACILAVRGDEAHVIRMHGYKEISSDFSVSLSTPTFQRMLQTHSPILVRDTRTDSSWIELPATAWIRSHISAPIMDGSRVAGFISLDSATPGAFQPEHTEQLRIFAEQAAIALQNADLYNTLSQHVNQLEHKVQARTAELLAAKERVETILHHSSDAVILLSSDGNIQQANPAFSEFFGQNVDDIFNTPFAALLDQEQQVEVQHAIQETLEGGVIVRREMSARRRNGTIFIADAVFARIAGRDRQKPAVVCSLRDITARKRTEEELRKALEKERQLSEMMRQFTTSVSHEFRNPLAAILSSTELTLRYGERMTEAQKQRHLETVQEQVHLLTQLLDDLMNSGEARSIHLYPHVDPEI
jgi:PAS domain S-box-containing protein